MAEFRKQIPELLQADLVRLDDNVWLDIKACALDSAPIANYGLDRPAARSTMPDIELSDLIENLRVELSRARQAGKGDELRFEVGQVELELSVGVTKEGGASGGIRFWVIEVGGEAKAASAATQRMKLTLTPQLAGGGKALITGEAEVGEGG
jgi:Trypsin-co-occurring domain 2